MTESETFFTFLTLIFSFFGMSKLFQKEQKKQPVLDEEEQEEEAEIDLDELACAVDELQNLVKQIRKMQDAVEKIDSCEPGILHSNFQMKWQSEDGKNQSCDFWADGDSRTNDLLRELYQTEIDRLTTSLPDVAEKIYDLTHEEQAKSNKIFNLSPAGEWLARKEMRSMTYREAIKKSLDNITIDAFAGNSENPHTYAETIPCCFPWFLLGMSVVSAYCSFNLTLNTELINFIKLASGAHEDQKDVIAFRSRMESFTNWILDEEIPESNSWFDAGTLQKKWNEFRMKGG